MWLLLRRPDHSLEIELDALADGGQILGGYPTMPEAREARERQRAKDEAEALRERGQRDLFGDGHAE